MVIHIRGAREHNLHDVEVSINPGLTVVTGVSGSGKTSLVFDTLYHEARRRFMEVFALGSCALRLAPAKVENITGLGPAVALGQNLLNRNPGSTLATASGLHPFLRLLYARFGERHCANCGAEVAVLSAEAILERLVAMSTNGPLEVQTPLVRGARGSHATLLASLERKLGRKALIIDGHAWHGQPLDGAQRHDISILISQQDGALDPAVARTLIDRAMAFGTPGLTIFQSGHTWTASTAPVCTACGTWFSDLEPRYFHTPCPYCSGSGCTHCAGTGLHPEAAAVRWQGLRIDQLLAYSVDDAAGIFDRAVLPRGAARLREEITRRLSALRRVGLGYIELNRPSPSLSRGEAQRVRLSAALISRLEDMLHVLDEPTIGQHPADVARLLPAIRDLNGPVVMIEHDRTAAALADAAIDLGPGAGAEGGCLLYDGPVPGLWQADTPTGRYFSLREGVQRPAARQPPDQYLTIRGANLRNLQQLDLSIPLERLTVVTGVSGSGKSTLVEDVFTASLSAHQPVGCTTLDGPWLAPTLVDQEPIGINPRSNPATYTGLADIIRDAFAAQTGLAASHFSFNRPEGACPVCKGLGAVEVQMRFLPSSWIACSECAGQRFNEEVLAASAAWGGYRYSIAEFYDLPISLAGPLLLNAGQLPAGKRQAAAAILQALQDVGLGYLSLGQPSPTLSGGEAQRVKLAKYLGKRSLAGQLLVLDEPSTGLHPQDVAGLLLVVDRLVRHGATIVVVEHNTDIIRAADWVLDLGPGAGPAGGRLLYAGPPAGLESESTSLTGQCLASEHTLQPVVRDTVPKERSAFLSIRGAAVHNLRSVDVDIPKGALTVVTGVSGSGKSSLVSDVLAAEAQRRFLETLSMYERQGTQEGPEAQVEEVSGLGVAVTVGSERRLYDRRATVGTATEPAHHLATLLAWCGQRRCLVCGALMERRLQWHCPACGASAPIAEARHFSSGTYAAACLTCHGLGTRQEPAPEKLIIHPEKPLISGAMYSPGFFPKGYLGKPGNGGYDLVQALAERYGFDPAVTPWREMTPQAQQAFLYGDPEPMLVHYSSKSGRTHTGRHPFPGFYGWVRDWDTGGTYTNTRPCPACNGMRLRPEYLAVSLQGANRHQLGVMSLRELSGLMDSFGAGITANNLVGSAAAEAELAAGSLATVRRRLRFLLQVGLGYLHLERPASTLSAGEAQRIKLAGLLGSGLTSLTLLLDEPTRGLHSAEVNALLEALRSLRDEGNTVIVIEHDPLLMRAADHLIDMGPGAGAQGGTIVAQGTPAAVAAADTITGAWLRNERKLNLARTRRIPQEWLTIRGARANNLKGDPVRLPLHTLAGICGVSGSGKSSLVIDTLGRALAPARQTTSVAFEPIQPGPHDAIEGAPSRTLLIDQSRAHVTNPADYLDLSRILRRLYAESADAQGLGLAETGFARACTACFGQGTTRIDLGFLPAAHSPCEVCRGTGFLPEAWEVRLKGLALPELFNLTIDQVYDLWQAEPGLARPLQAARDVGLGYLVLRQPGYTLSGGEAQRLKIAQELCRPLRQDTLYILDEPTVGQHLEDVARLIDVLQRLVDNGQSVLICEHHPHLLAACDWLVELGPAGGPEGGYVIAAGAPEVLAAGSTPTAGYLRGVLEADA
ncbi:MAG: excinuclease ABC subunit UvrA [Anaerolineae bacterium]